jgi:recombination protein RecA
MNKATALSKEDRMKALEQKMGTIGVSKSEFKTGLEMANVSFLPTGQMEVDAVLGLGGGLPRGTLVEFCGESQSGKSYLAIKLMAEAQKLGEMCCYVNVENSFYPPRAKELGVQVDDPELFRVLENLETAEQYGSAIYALVESQLFSVIVVDSIGALIPESEYNKDLADEARIGAHARFIKRFTRKLMNLCSRTGVIVVLINQQYMGTGKMPGTMMLTASGGNAMNFFPHMRLWISRINSADGKVIDSEGNIVGGKSKLVVYKTRYGEPLVETVFPIMFGKFESDLIAEFFYKAKSRKYEYIKEVRKTLKYTIVDTGEVIESKDPQNMIRLLCNAQAPSKKSKNDNSQTAFEYLCGQMKITADQAKKIITLSEIPNASGYNQQDNED